MAIVDLVMPKMGESIMEATVLRWHKKVGDTVKLDETVLDIATDKVDSEVPSTANGVITEILFKENDVVPVGAVIAKIEAVSATFVPTTPPPPVQPATPQQPVYNPPPVQPIQQPVVAAQPEQVPFTPQPTYVPSANTSAGGNNKFFSPLVLNIANSEGLSLSELERIPGTGADGRVSKRDILQYIADKKAGKVAAFVAPQPQPIYQQPVAAQPIPPAVPVVETFTHQEQVIAPEPPPPTIIAQAAAVQQEPVIVPIPEPMAAQPQPEPVYVAPQIQTQTVAPQPQPIQQQQQPIQVEFQQPQPVYIAPVPEPVTVQPQPQPEPVYVAPPIIEAPKPSVEIIEMDRMRKLIAQHMVNSKQTSAHVTSFAEADVTNMVLWREKKKEDFEKRTGTKITFTPMFIECLIKVMKRFPIINSSVEGDKILIKNYFNIGMATALPNNNLIVPVIKNAEQMGLVNLAKSVNALAANARNGKLKPDDTQGGTFTLTNVGSFGSLMGTPIINQPQVAILAVGAIKKRPVVLETEKGDFIGIRHMMYLSLSYDHRIIDGSVGASFLTEVAKEFENWNVNRELKLVVQEQYVD